MQTLYNSDSFVVVSFDIPAGDDAPAQGSAPVRLQRGGFEIVDKQARKEIFIEGALAEHFKQGVQALVAAQTQGDQDALHAVIDDYIAGYTALAQQPVVLH
jgi:hypothetical protein